MASTNPSPEISGTASSKSNTLEGEGRSEGNKRPEDIEWLSSLSESELDFLISLKELATRRARNVGYKDLGDKFDVRMLCGLGFVLLEYFRERIQSTSQIPNSAETLTLLSECGLSTLNCEGYSISKSSIEGTNDLSFVTPRRKRMWEGLCEETAHRRKKHKTADTE